MKRYVMNMGAGLQGLRLQEVARPVHGPGEALVRVGAVSLNFREISILVHGSYPLPVKPDVVAVAAGAGEVVEVGASVDRVRPGQRVVASIFPRWLDGPFRGEMIDQLGGSLDGMLSEYVCLPQEALVPVPSHLSDEEAATLPCAGADRCSCDLRGWRHGAAHCSWQLHAAGGHGPGHCMPSPASNHRPGFLFRAGARSVCLLPLGRELRQGRDPSVPLTRRTSCNATQRPSGNTVSSKAKAA